jgi:hypothetical protein
LASSNSQIMNHWHTVGLLGRVISSSQGLYLHRTTQQRQTRTNIHALSGIRTRDPVYERLRPAPQTTRPPDWQLCHTCLKLCHTCLRLCHTCLKLCHTCLRLCHTCLRLCHTCLKLWCVTGAPSCMSLFYILYISQIVAGFSQRIYGERCGGEICVRLLWFTHESPCHQCSTHLCHRPRCVRQAEQSASSHNRELHRWRYAWLQSEQSGQLKVTLH